MKLLYIILLFILSITASSKTLMVGLNSEIYQYASITSAAKDAVPNDTILIMGGIYSGGEFIENLSGDENSPITILAVTGDSVVFRGGSQAIHFVQIENVIIEGLIFQGQTGNGVNIDDGGSVETPTKNIVIRHCHWMDMNASGNNDLLKLSGVDNFLVENCSFKNGSAGGSLVDMVGCHNGIFKNNLFENAGSNCIQAKGGSSDITILRNMFINGGYRSINIGGSTGLQYFRPLGVDYEAKNINVFSNLFISSQAPIAYVGAIECHVVNNTIFNPEKWAIRILQESVEGFAPCGNNSFVNNICYLNNSSPMFTLNIGPNTSGESFFFANNLWYNFENENWQGPNLPVEEIDGIIGDDPLFINQNEMNFIPNEMSPAIGSGYYNPDSIPFAYVDFNGFEFNIPPTIGAFESYINTVEKANIYANRLSIYPNPCKDHLFIKIPSNFNKFNLYIYDLLGNKIFEQYIQYHDNNKDFEIRHDFAGNGSKYLIVIRTEINLFYGFLTINK